MSRLEKIFATIGSYALPSSCIVCESYQALALCKACKESLRSDNLLNYECCLQCGIPLFTDEIAEKRCAECVINPPYFDETFCLDRYTGKLQNALHQLKYQKRLVYAHNLAVAWNQMASMHLHQVQASSLIPVPLSEQKLCARGFNQSW